MCLCNQHWCSNNTIMFTKNKNNDVALIVQKICIFAELLLWEQNWGCQPTEQMATHDKHSFTIWNALVIPTSHCSALLAQACPRMFYIPLVSMLAWQMPCHGVSQHAAYCLFHNLLQHTAHACSFSSKAFLTQSTAFGEPHIKHSHTADYVFYQEVRCSFWLLLSMCMLAAAYHKYGPHKLEKALPFILVHSYLTKVLKLSSL